MIWHVSLDFGLAHGAWFHIIIHHAFITIRMMVENMVSLPESEPPHGLPSFIFKISTSSVTAPHLATELANCKVLTRSYMCLCPGPC